MTTVTPVTQSVRRSGQYLVSEPIHRQRMLTATDATATPHELRLQEGSKQAGHTALWGRQNRTKLFNDKHRRKTEKVVIRCPHQTVAVADV